MITDKAYLSAITVANISQSFLPTRWRQKSTGIRRGTNYVTVTETLKTNRVVVALRFGISLVLVLFCSV